MTAEQEHPGFFALDRMALGLQVDASVAGHVAGCGACAAHLATLSTVSAVPSWAVALDAPVAPRAPRRRRASLGPWALGVSGALALAGLALLVFRPPGSPGPSEIAESSESPDTAATAEHTTLRGAPSIGLFIRRGGRVSLWDGDRPVLPGDQLRLEVVPEAFAYIGVFSPAGPDSFQTLYSAPADPSETLLPPAWEVDGAGDSESLVVVLSMRATSAEEVPGLVSGASPDRRVWLRILDIPKTAVAP